MTACTWADRLTAFLSDQLPDGEMQAVVDHVETCPSCQEALKSLSADSRAECAAARHEGTPEGFDVQAMIRRVGLAVGLQETHHVAGYELLDGTPPTAGSEAY